MGRMDLILIMKAYTNKISIVILLWGILNQIHRFRGRQFESRAIGCLTLDEEIENIDRLLRHCKSRSSRRRAWSGRHRRINNLNMCTGTVIVCDVLDVCFMWNDGLGMVLLLLFLLIGSI